MFMVDLCESLGNTCSMPQIYAKVYVDGKTKSLHRHLMEQLMGRELVWDEVVHHKNGNRLDNRIENLRDVSKQTNQQNGRTAQKTSRSGLIGAIWLEQRKCWKAEIRVNGATKMIGRYKTAQEAHEAYVVAKRRLHAGCTL